MYAATQDLGERLRDTDDEGADLDSDTYLNSTARFLSWVTLVSFLVPEAVSSRPSSGHLGSTVGTSTSPTCRR